MAQTTYQHVVIEGAMSPPTTTEIAAIESAVGVGLPEDFKEFLRVANGGHIEYEIDVGHPEGMERMGFGLLFATRRSPGATSALETFLGELEAAWRIGPISREVLPIARDGGGSMLFLDLTAEGGGRIVAFVHGLPAWAGGRQTDAFVEVAPSFSDYISKLFISEELARDLIDDAQGQGDRARLAEIREWLEIGMPDWRDRLGSDALEPDRTGKGR
jgi:hypothetical protein